MPFKLYVRIICCLIGCLSVSLSLRAQEINQQALDVYKLGIFFLIVILLLAAILLYYCYQKAKANTADHLGMGKDSISKQEKISKQERELFLQNEEIASQNEELLQIQQELLEQQRFIDKKNQELKKVNQRLVSNEQVMLKAVKKLKEKERIIKEQNQKLEAEVKSRTAELSQKNKELIDYTNQLEQFAFVTGHNLRAPIARLLGLVSIMDLENFSNPDNKIYIKNLEIVTKELDAIIIDLNTVLEVKRTSEIKSEKIDFKEKINKVRLFMKQIYSNVEFDIYANFAEINEINSINIYWESILYNLISNAIKYRHHDRACQISISTSLSDKAFVLEVKDNGIGIDLDTYGDKIFGLYKRFHKHVDGKGLGLHLVRLQVENLGGTITVESELDTYTRFIITIPEVAHLKT